MALHRECEDGLCQLRGVLDRMKDNVKWSVCQERLHLLQVVCRDLWYPNALIVDQSGLVQIIE